MHVAPYARGRLASLVPLLLSLHLCLRSVIFSVVHPFLTTLSHCRDRSHPRRVSATVLCDLPIRHFARSLSLSHALWNSPKLIHPNRWSLTLSPSYARACIFAAAVSEAVSLMCMWLHMRGVA